MIVTLPATRIVRGASNATLSHQFTDADGEPAAPSGTATVSVTRSDGTAVSTGAVSGSTTDPRTVTLAVAEVAVVDRLTAVWSDDGVAVATEVVDVVGTSVSLAAIRAAEPSLSSEAPAGLLRARSAAEDRFLATQNRSPFLRFHVQSVVGEGTGTLHGLHFPDLVEVRWARAYTSATTYTALTTAELAAIRVPDPMSQPYRNDGKPWPCGRIDIGYVFGMSSLPADLRDAFYGAIRAQVTRTNTGIPDKAVGFGSIDGINFQISTPGQRGAIYGIPAVDDVWNKYRDPRPLVA